MQVDLLHVTTLADLQDFWAVEAAAHAHDFIALPADPLEELLPLLDGQPRAGELIVPYLVRQEGLPVAILTMTLPLLDNPQVVSLDLAVHPGHRRHGHGRTLLAAALAEVRRRGRSRVFLNASAPVETGDGAAGSLLRAAGARPALEEHRRLLDLDAHPAGPAPEIPDGYHLVQWLDRCPDALVEGAARLAGRMTVDAPLGDMDYAPEQWDVDRYRSTEADAAARGRVRVATAVVHEATGAVAGITDIGVNRSRPEIAYQWDTIVDPEHRGHGLGMLLKQANHRQLVDRIEDVRWINTWNAASNSHMVQVNDALGFQPMERWLEWQLDL